MANNMEFARNLVKGRIAETIFSQMFREGEKCTVLEFGYEKIVPELVRNGEYFDRSNPVIETLRIAPDFVIINRDESKYVRLVEVKYRYRLDPKEILETARKMHSSWNPSYLFIATLSGFYFEEVQRIIDSNGYITPLNEIAKEIQDEYLKILVDYEKINQDTNIID